MFRIAVVSCLFVVCSAGALVPIQFIRVEPALHGRIVGGERHFTNTGFEYLVSIHNYGGQSCGGSLYKSNVVITAAHCLRDMSVGELGIRAGSAFANKGGSFVGVSHYKIHPDFDTKTKSNDIGLIFLKTRLSLGGSIKTIGLATSTPKDGALGSISGWGIENFYNKDSAPESLKHADLNVVSRENCMSDRYAYGESRILPNMICAMGNEMDSCQGDSGGPFVVDGKLAGVISWGFGCAESMFPGVYANTFLQTKWIESNV